MKETGYDAKREALSVDELADKVREIAAIIHTDEFHKEFHELERLADEIKAAWRRERESLMLGPRSWEECIERYRKAREIHDDLY